MRCSTQPPDPAAEELIAGHLGLAEDIAAQLFSHPSHRQWLDEACGVAADALHRAARRFDPSRPDCLPFEAWAAIVIWEKVRDLLRRRVRQAYSRPRTFLILNNGGVPERPARPVTPDAWPADVAELLGRLTPAQVDAVTRRFLLGQSYAEAGRATGRTREAARRLCVRAVAELRGVLAAG